MFFSPRGVWTEKQIIRYTENWFVKGVDTEELGGMAIHSDHSYVHHPDLLGLTALESMFRLLEATVPAALEGLDTAIETTNDLNRDLEKNLAGHMRSMVGPIAVPDEIYFVAKLPKTRSGKVMRRVLKAVANNTSVGDLTTLEDKSSVEEVIKAYQELKKERKKKK